MTTIKAMVWGGRLEVEELINLPDGTELLVPLPDGLDQTEEDNWDNSPEGIADWLKWYDSLEPLIFTPEEEADIAAWRQKVKEYTIANMHKHIEGRENNP